RAIRSPTGVSSFFVCTDAPDYIQWRQQRISGFYTDYSGDGAGGGDVIRLVACYETGNYLRVYSGGYTWNIRVYPDCHLSVFYGHLWGALGVGRFSCQLVLGGSGTMGFVNRVDVALFAQTSWC